MDFGILPPLIWEHILSFLDFRSLVSCCRVCKSWYALVKESPILWKEACRKFGLIIREDEYRDSEYWKAYLRLIFGREEQMKEGQAFEISEVTNSGGCISIAAYYKGKIAIAFSSYPVRIEIWNNRVCEITIHTDELTPRYLKFDNKYIMAGFFNGWGIMWWDIISKRCITSELLEDGSQWSSLDFLTEYNIAVGGFLKYIYIWNLSTGDAVEQIFLGKDCSSNGISKISLTEQPVVEDGGKKVIILLSLFPEEITGWKIKFIPCDMSSSTICVEKSFSIIPVFSYMSDWETQPQLKSMHFDGKSVYHAQCSNDVRNNKIFVWDLGCDIFTDQYKVNSFIKNLLGVGEKYVTIHAQEANEEVLIVFDRTSRTEAKVFSFPRDICRDFRTWYPVITGETSWLDGLNGENDEGIICLFACRPNALKAVKWVSRTSVVV